jgi:tight adherence protein B
MHKMRAMAVGLLAGMVIGFMFFRHPVGAAVVGIAGAMILLAEARKRHIRKVRDAFMEEFHELIVLIDSEWRNDGIGKVLERLMVEKKDVMLKRAPMFYRRIQRVLGPDGTLAQNRQWSEVFRLQVIKGLKLKDIAVFARQWEAADNHFPEQRRLLRRTEETLREKIAIMREIDTIIAQKRGEAAIMGAAPLLILGILNFMSPDYVEPLYRETSGRVVMGTCLVLWYVCVKWMLRIVEIRAS